MSKPKPLNIISSTTQGPPMLTFDELCHRHGGFPTDSPLYTNPPTDAPAVFSTNYGEREYKTVIHPTQPGISRSDVDRDIHDYAHHLKKKYPEATDTMEELTYLEDIHKYFDIHDIWYQGLGFLWEVVMQITLENRWRNDIILRRIEDWETAFYDKFTASPIDMDVYDNVFDDADREWMSWKDFREWDMEMVRQKLNSDRLALEPQLKVEREAAEAERLREEAEAERLRQEAEEERLRQEAEVERLRQEAEAERLRLEEEQRAVEQQRLEDEKTEAEAVNKPEPVQEAAQKEEADRRTASRERNERFDRAQAQNPAVSHGSFNNGPAMHPYSNKGQRRIHNPDPNAPMLNWHQTLDLRFGPSQLQPRAPLFQYGQVPPPMPIYGPQDARRSLHDSHQTIRRNMSQPVFVHDSYDFRNEHSVGPSTAYAPNMSSVLAMPAMHQQGFPSGPSGRERKVSHSSGPRSQDGQPQVNVRDPDLQVFVGGFYHMTSELLTEIMSECGRVEHVHLPPLRNQGRNHAFVTYSDAESVDRAIARFNGKLVATPGDSFTMACAYPRYSPKSPDYEPFRHEHTNPSEGRRHYSRRSSNASQQHRRLPSNSSYHGAPGAVSQASGSHTTLKNVSHDPRAPPIKEFGHHRIPEPTPAQMIATDPLPINVPLTPLISQKQEHQSITSPSVSAGDENMRPGHNMSPNKIANTSRSNIHMEPLGVRHPNVRSAGLTINVHDPATGSHSDNVPLSASSTVANSSAAVPQSDHHSDTSTSRNNHKKQGKNKKNKPKISAHSGESSQTEALAASSAFACNETSGNSSYNLEFINEKPVDAASKNQSGKQHVDVGVEVGTNIQDRKSATAEDLSRAELNSNSPQVEISIDTTDEDLAALMLEDPSILQVKKTRAPELSSNLRLGRRTHTSGFLEEGTSAARSSSMFYDDPDKYKEVVYRSQSASPSSRSLEMIEGMAVPAISDVAATSEAVIDTPTQTTVINASSVSTRKSDVNETSVMLAAIPTETTPVSSDVAVKHKAIVKPPTETADVEVSCASAEKITIARSNTPIKRTNQPLVALPLPITNKASSPMVDAEKTQATGKSRRSLPSEDIASWAETVSRDTTASAKQLKREGNVKKDDSPKQSDNSRGKCSKKNMAQGGVKRDDLPKQSGSNADKSSKKNVPRTAEKTTNMKTTGEKPRQNKGKGRAITPDITEEKEKPITHVENELESTKVRITPKDEETAVTESITEANSNITSSFEPSTEVATSLPFIQEDKLARPNQPSSSSSASTMAPRADIKIPKQPAMTESLSIFGRKKKAKNKKENAPAAKKSKTPTKSTDKLTDAPVVSESSRYKQEVEQKTALGDVDPASKVPLPVTPKPDSPKPGTPKPANTSTSKGRSLWGLMVDSVFHTNLGRTGVFAAIVFIVFAVMMKGAWGAVNGTSITNFGGNGRSRDGISFHGGMVFHQISVILTNPQGMEKEGTFEEK